MTQSSLFTTTLSNSTLNLDSYNLTMVSIVLLSGTGTFKGNLKIGPSDSTPIDLIIGLPITITSKPNETIGGIITSADNSIIAILGQP